MMLKVLIVDDDPVTLFIHRQNVIKSELSSDPVAFSNGKEVLDYLKEQTDDDVVYFILLDINMPEMNGWQFLQALNSKDADRVYTVMVSSSVDSRDHQKAQEFKSVIGYLEKPMSVALLRDFMDASEFDVVRNVMNNS